jgi:hypothetical protein
MFENREIFEHKRQKLTGERTKVRIEGIMPERRINKMADLQQTKFLRLFFSTYVHY